MVDSRTGPAETDPGMQLVHQLRAITVGLDLLASSFAQRSGLHPTDLRALISLLDAARSGTPATPGWLGRQLGLNSAGTTALVDRLERLGYVRRSRDTRDRRRVLLEVDDRAVALGWSFFGPLITDVVAATRRLSGEELATVQRFLREMGQIVARRAGAADPPAVPGAGPGAGVRSDGRPGAPRRGRGAARLSRES